MTTYHMCAARKKKENIAGNRITTMRNYKVLEYCLFVKAKLMEKTRKWRASIS